MKRNRYRNRLWLDEKSCRGSVLVLVLVFSGIILAVTAASLRTATLQAKLADRSHRFQQALAVADAGVERMIYALQIPGGSNGAILETVSDVGQFEVTSTGSGAERVIDSIGYIPNKANYEVKRRVRSTVRLKTTPSFFKWGLFAYDDIIFDNAFTMSSWDSKDGNPPASVNHHNTFGNIGSLQDISVANGSKINGSIQAGGDISGMKKPCQGNNVDGQPNTTIEFTPPTPPGAFPDADLLAAKTANNNLTGISGPDPAKNPYNPSTQILSDANGNVTLAPGVYYFKGISFTGNNSKLTISPADRVKIYLEGDMSFNNHNQINAAGQPINLQIYQKSGTMTLDNGCKVNAAILAPNTDITFANTVDYFGSLTGKRVTIGNAKMFVYDEDLGNAAGSIEGVKALSWVEVTP